MKPSDSPPHQAARRRFLCSALGLWGCWTLAGCAAPFVRSQSPEDEPPGSRDEKLVGDYAVPYGTFMQKVEGIALVTGLKGTGEDPPMSPQRAVLLRDMQARYVPHPEQVLASPDTAMVMVRGFMKPGIQKGDRFDLEVRLPTRTEATSLRDGWMMSTRLKEMAVMDDRVFDGHTLAMGEGPILIDPAANSETNPVAAGRGRILGGGVASKSRTLGLVLKPDRQTLRASAQLGTEINRRFHMFSGGVKKGVARPKDEQYVELDVHPRYKDNLPRYMQVVRSIAVAERPAQRLARLALLERQLLDPITASDAALELEAIGNDGIKVLEQGIKSDNIEVRFYAAEALAYLDETSAAAPLAEAARQETAFRVYAMTALSAMDDYAAYDQLRTLLDLPSAETRYGAFRALWAMNPTDALVRGEDMNGQFSYHVLNTSGPPMIHATRSFRPEIVVFGHEQRLRTPLLLEAGGNIVITSGDDQTITVSCFSVGQADQKRIVENRVDVVIRAIVELGGHYPDVVQALEQAKQKNLLSGRFEVDALPQVGRRYRRAQEESEEESDISVPNALPDLFPAWNDAFRLSRSTKPLPATPKKPGRLKAMFARMTGRDAASTE